MARVGRLMGRVGSNKILSLRSRGCCSPSLFSFFGDNMVALFEEAS